MIFIISKLWTYYFKNKKFYWKIQKKLIEKKKVEKHN